MTKPWHKITSRIEWDKAVTAVLVAARIEVPAALKVARDEQKRIAAVKEKAERVRKGNFDEVVFVKPKKGKK